MPRLKRHARLGKYRIDRPIGRGGYAIVYQAFDTVEGVNVALKVPRSDFVRPETIGEFRREAQLAASLDHPNILPIKNADFIDDVFVIASPLADETLADRMARRYKMQTALSFATQLLEAVSYAHSRGVIHCDIKPENLLLFGSTKLRLADFGIAKVAQRQGTLTGGGTGTIGYLAPEQAFGKPSSRSDVFSTGLVLYRLFGGQLPSWPYEWPPDGYERVRQNISPSFINLIRRAIHVDHKKRYADGTALLAAFQRIKSHALRTTKKRRQTQTSEQKWKSQRVREFVRKFGRTLQTKYDCSRCGHPISEHMGWCPWCGRKRRRHAAPTTFPARCRRCGRGVKKDWAFCAWCYGGRIQEPSNRRHSDVRYVGRCSNKNCDRKDLMPFMRYCPWCRTKVKRAWPLEHGSKCTACKWGVASEYWRNCPWCGKIVVSQTH